MSRYDPAAVRFASSIAVLVVSLGACGSPTDFTESRADATTSTVETTPQVLEPTLSVSPDEFVDIWNTFFGGVHPHLIIESFDVDDGTHLIRRWSQDTYLELVVDPESGELSEVALRGGFGGTSQNITLAFMWFGLVNASNREVNLALDEFLSFNPIAEQIGLPPFEGELPEGFGPLHDELYRSEGVVDDVLYVFEEVERHEYLLTATPAP
jgi:hypothetical protein